MLYSEIDMEGDIYEIDESAEKARKSEVLYMRSKKKIKLSYCSNYYY